MPESTHPFIAPPAPEILISSTPLQDRTASQTTHVSQSTDVGLSSSEEEEGEGHGRDASDETDDTIVNPLEDDDDEGRHDTLKVVAEEVGLLDETALDDEEEEAYAEMEGGGTKGFLDVLRDVLWNFWQGILGVFGCASTEEKETGQPVRFTFLLRVRKDVTLTLLYRGLKPDREDSPPCGANPHSRPCSSCRLRLTFHVPSRTLDLPPRLPLAGVHLRSLLVPISHFVPTRRPPRWIRRSIPGGHLRGRAGEGGQSR